MIDPVITPPVASSRSPSARLAARPDYDGGSIVNLMASIIAAAGGVARYPLLEGLDGALLKEARSIVLIVVDGLGHEFLSASGPGQIMRRHLLRSMTSVFPPTTATAVTTFLTGLAPQQHGLTGWFMYFKEIGSVVTVLPFTTRLGAKALTSAGVQAGPLLGHTPIFDAVDREAVCVTPRRIADSEFNRAHVGRAQLSRYETLPEFIAAIEQAVNRRSSRSFIYAYWPELDHLAHSNGIGSDTVRTHLGELDTAYEELLSRLAGSNAVVLLTADHGFVDIPESNVVRLSDHPQLEDTLLLPLCGEPRTAYCYVAPGRDRDFRRYVESELSDSAAWIDSASLIDEGYFGPGTAHPALKDRIGNHTLLMRDGFAVRDRLPGEARFEPVGMHGGGSTAELLVPLVVAPL